MKTINTWLIAAITLQLSTSCFSQDSQSIQHNVKLITVVNPVAIARVRNAVNVSATQKIAAPVDNEIKNSSEKTTDLTAPHNNYDENKLAYSVQATTTNPLNENTPVRKPYRAALTQ